MFWSLSFQLLPEEVVLEDSASRGQSGIKPAYSVFLTNKRAIFRFDGLGSSLTQSFFYHEMLDIRPSRRLFFTYLLVKTEKRDFLLNTSEPEYWMNKILEIKKKTVHEPAQQPAASPERKKRELLDMLTVLRKNALLTDSELEEKIHQLDSMKF